MLLISAFTATKTLQIKCTVYGSESPDAIIWHPFTVLPKAYYHLDDKTALMVEMSGTNYIFEIWDAIENSEKRDRTTYKVGKIELQQDFSISLKNGNEMICKQYVGE